MTFVDQDDPTRGERAVTPRTRAFFAESVANPVTQVLDQRAAEITHTASVPLVIENTVDTPYLVRPDEHGADFVVPSATKYLSGHGTSLGGVAAVHHPGIPGNQWQGLAGRYLRRGGGSVFSSPPATRTAISTAWNGASSPCG